MNDYSKILIALLLSNRNRSLRIIRSNLDIDHRRFNIKINEDLPNGDYIISIHEIKK